MHLKAHVESRMFIYEVIGITFQAFSLVSVVISIFIASQYPALPGPFIASCHLGLSEAFAFAASPRVFHHSVSLIWGFTNASVVALKAI